MIESLEKPGKITGSVDARPENEDGKESLEGTKHISVDIFRHSGLPFYQLNSFSQKVIHQFYW